MASTLEIILQHNGVTYSFDPENPHAKSSTKGSVLPSKDGKYVTRILDSKQFNSDLQSNLKELQQIFPHPSLVKVVAVIQDPQNSQRCHVVSERAMGHNMSDFLRQGLSPDRHFDVIYQLVEVVAHLHRNHQAHGNISPRDILIDVGMTKDRARGVPTSEGANAVEEALVHVQLLDAGLVAALSASYNRNSINEFINIEAKVYLADEVFKQTEGPGPENRWRCLASDVSSLGKVIKDFMKKGNFGMQEDDMSQLVKRMTNGKEMDRPTMDQVFEEMKQMKEKRDLLEKELSFREVPGEEDSHAKTCKEQVSTKAPNPIDKAEQLKSKTATKTQDKVPNAPESSTEESAEAGAIAKPGSASQKQDSTKTSVNEATACKNDAPKGTTSNVQAQPVQPAVSSNQQGAGTLTPPSTKRGSATGAEMKNPSDTGQGMKSPTKKPPVRPATKATDTSPIPSQTGKKTTPRPIPDTGRTAKPAMVGKLATPDTTSAKGSPVKSSAQTKTSTSVTSGGGDDKSKEMVQDADVSSSVAGSAAPRHVKSSCCPAWKLHLFWFIITVVVGLGSALACLYATHNCSVDHLCVGKCGDGYFKLEMSCSPRESIFSTLMQCGEPSNSHFSNNPNTPASDNDPTNQLKENEITGGSGGESAGENPKGDKIDTNNVNNAGKEVEDNRSSMFTTIIKLIFCTIVIGAFVGCIVWTYTVWGQKSRASRPKSVQKKLT